MDTYANFAEGTMDAGIAAGATTGALVTGHGSRFPSAPFNAVLWNASDYGAPHLDPAAEIVRVTSLAGDNISAMTRAQEGTSDVNHNTGGKVYKLTATITARTINTEIALSLPTTYAGSPEGNVDGNPGRICYDTTGAVMWVKTTTAGTLTGWV